jgi:hypothetical protein
LYGVQDLANLRGATGELTAENMSADLVMLLSRFGVAREKSPGQAAAQEKSMQDRFNSHQAQWRSDTAAGAAYRLKAAAAGHTYAVRDQCCLGWTPTGPNDLAPASGMLSPRAMEELQRIRLEKRSAQILQACIKDAIEFASPGLARKAKLLSEARGNDERGRGNAYHGTRCMRCFSARHTDLNLCPVPDAAQPIVRRPNQGWAGVNNAQHCHWCMAWGHYPSECRRCYTCLRWGHLSENCNADFDALEHEL